MTAVDEACINAIEHGNKENADIKVLVELIAEDTRLQVDIHDRGKGIRGIIQKPDIDARIAGKQHARGWGLFQLDGRG